MAAITRGYRERAGTLDIAKPFRPSAKGKSAAGLWWEDVKKRAKVIVEAPKELGTSELAMKAAGVFGPGAILRQKAVRDVTRGFLKHLAPHYRTRKEALQAAKPHVSAIGRLPQETLDLLKSVEVRHLPRSARARFREFSSAGEFATAKATRRVPVVRKREILLDPEKAEPGSVYHEVGHLIQKTTKDPALVKSLKPVTEEYLQSVQQSSTRGFQSLTERHARDFASDTLKRLQWEKPGKRFSVKELDEIASWSLENILRKTGK